MKPEVNAVLAEVKAQMNSMDNATPQPAMPDFKAMSIMESTKYCVEHGVSDSKDIADLTGKSIPTVQTALWKMRNPKKVKAQYRRAKKLRDLKAGIVKEGVKATKPKAKVAKVAKVAKPKITNGQYDDGMDTPWRDAVMRRGGNFDFLETKTTNIHNELMAENRRLKVLLDHYESLLFKGGK